MPLHEKETARSRCESQGKYITPTPDVAGIREDGAFDTQCGNRCIDQPSRQRSASRQGRPLVRREQAVDPVVYAKAAAEIDRGLVFREVNVPGDHLIRK